MRIPFTLFFLVLILGEVAVFILVGEAIGVLATLGLVLCGIIGGGLLLRWTGVATLARIRAELDAGRVPARPAAEGALQAFAALLIILPGFITDVAGLLLLIPAVRSVLWRGLSRRVQIRTAQAGPSPHPDSGLIELEPDDYRAAPRPDSPWLPDRRR